MKNFYSFKKGIAPLVVIIIVAVLAAGGFGAYKARQNAAKKSAEEKAAMEKEKMMKEEAMMMKEELHLELKPQNRSAQPGRAVISEMDGKAHVVLNLEGAPVNIEQPAHIHIGACPNPGAVKYPLSNVVNGQSETMLTVSFEELLKGLPLAINVHKSAAEIKTYVSCGDITVPEAMMKAMNEAMEPEEGMMKKEGTMMQGESMMKFSGAVLAGKSSLLLDFNKADYEAALKSDKLVVLYFYANWCPICRLEVPRLYNAFNELTTDKVIGLRVNYNDNQTDDNERELARQFGVGYQHTKVFLKNGQRILKSPETWDKDRYLREIQAAL